MYWDYDPASPTFLPLQIQLDLKKEFTGPNEKLSVIGEKLKVDLVTRENWNHGNCRDRLVELASHLNHY